MTRTAESRSELTPREPTSGRSAAVLASIMSELGGECWPPVVYPSLLTKQEDDDNVCLFIGV